MAALIIILIDAVLKLNTGFYINGELTLDKKFILKNYFKTGNFIFDCLTLIPISYNIFLGSNYFPHLS